MKLSLTNDLKFQYISSFVFSTSWMKNPVHKREKKKIFVQRKNYQWKWLNLHFLVQSNNCIALWIIKQAFPPFWQISNPSSPLHIFPSRNNIPANANSNRNCTRYLIKHALTFLPYVHMHALSLFLSFSSERHVTGNRFRSLFQF